MASEKKSPTPIIEEKSGSMLQSLPFLFIFLLLLFLLGCQQLPPKNNVPAPPPSGAELFKSKCSKCHPPELALQKYRSAEVWLETINRMIVEHNADINREEIDLLIKYHVDRQKKEAAIFKAKCQKCHPGKVFLEKNLTPAQVRAIVKRMQLKAGNTITDQDVELIINYHIRSQQEAVEITLNTIFGIDKGEQQKRMKRGMELFVRKCSACHNLSRALSVFKDQEVWTQTIKRMQSYSKGAITDLEVKELVDFHVSRQQKEIDTFQETCTKCHDDKRINSRSMSEEQWMETIKRMQRKAPELITDEKVNLLAAYFHRRELTIAKIFSGRCQQCHFFISGKSLPPGSTEQLNGLVALASEEFGQSLRLTDIDNLQEVHVQRQKRIMQLYETNCSVCHSLGVPEKGQTDQENPDKRSRSEWISFIAVLQGMELSKETQKSIFSQIDFHRSKQ